MCKHIALWVAAWLVMAGARHTPARADLALGVQATESMMNSQGLILTLAVRDLGIDPSVTLPFISAVDPVTGAFSYTLQPGLTYLGQSAALQVSGSFDASSQSWLWTSSGHIGSTNIGGNGSTTFSGDPMSFDIFIPLNLDETIVSNVTYDNTATRTASTGTITVQDALTGIVKSSGTHTDSLIITGPDAGKWRWDTGLITGKNGSFVLDSAGFSPFPGGGAGTFAVNVTAVPEPRPMVLALGGLGLLGVGLVGRQCAVRVIVR
jgi:hypothetical protein